MSAIIWMSLFFYCVSQAIIPSSARGVLSIKLLSFENRQGRTYEGQCCDPTPQDGAICHNQCDYVMRLIISGLGRANDHVFLFHRPLKYDSNDLHFQQHGGDLTLTILFDDWPADGRVRMNAFFYDYDDFDHTTALVDWFETELRGRSSVSKDGQHELLVHGNRQSDKTRLVLEWSRHCENDGQEDVEADDCIKSPAADWQAWPWKDKGSMQTSQQQDLVSSSGNRGIYYHNESRLDALLKSPFQPFSTRSQYRDPQSPIISQTPDSTEKSVKTVSQSWAELTKNKSENLKSVTKETILTQTILKSPFKPFWHENVLDNKSQGSASAHYDDDDGDGDGKMRNLSPSAEDLDPERKESPFHPFSMLSEMAPNVVWTRSSEEEMAVAAMASMESVQKYGTRMQHTMKPPPLQPKQKLIRKEEEESSKNQHPKASSQFFKLTEERQNSVNRDDSAKNTGTFTDPKVKQQSAESEQLNKTLTDQKPKEKHNDRTKALLDKKQATLKNIGLDLENSNGHVFPSPGKTNLKQNPFEVNAKADSSDAFDAMNNSTLSQKTRNKVQVARNRLPGQLGTPRNGFRMNKTDSSEDTAENSAVKSAHGRLDHRTTSVRTSVSTPFTSVRRPQSASETSTKGSIFSPYTTPFRVQPSDLKTTTTAVRRDTTATRKNPSTTKTKHIFTVDTTNSTTTAVKTTTLKSGWGPLENNRFVTWIPATPPSHWVPKDRYQWAEDKFPKGVLHSPFAAKTKPLFQLPDKGDALKKILPSGADKGKSLPLSKVPVIPAPQRVKPIAQSGRSESAFQVPNSPQKSGNLASSMALQNPVQKSKENAKITSVNIDMQRSQVAKNMVNDVSKETPLINKKQQHSLQSPMPDQRSADQLDHSRDRDSGQSSNIVNPMLLHQKQEQWLERQNAKTLILQLNHPGKNDFQTETEDQSEVGTEAKRINVEDISKLKLNTRSNIPEENGISVIKYRTTEIPEGENKKPGSQPAPADGSHSVAEPARQEVKSSINQNINDVNSTLVQMVFKPPIESRVSVGKKNVQSDEKTARSEEKSNIDQNSKYVNVPSKPPTKPRVSTDFIEKVNGQTTLSTTSFNQTKKVSKEHSQTQKPKNDRNGLSPFTPSRPDIAKKAGDEQIRADPVLESKTGLPKSTDPLRSQMKLARFTPLSQTLESTQPGPSIVQVPGKHKTVQGEVPEKHKTVQEEVSGKHKTVHEAVPGKHKPEPTKDVENSVKEERVHAVHYNKISPFSPRPDSQKPVIEKKAGENRQHLINSVTARITGYSAVTVSSPSTVTHITNKIKDAKDALNKTTVISPPAGNIEREVKLMSSPLPSKASHSADKALLSPTSSKKSPFSPLPSVTVSIDKSSLPLAKNSSLQQKTNKGISQSTDKPTTSLSATSIFSKPNEPLAQTSQNHHQEGNSNTTEKTTPATLRHISTSAGSSVEKSQRLLAAGSQDMARDDLNAASSLREESIKRMRTQTFRTPTVVMWFVTNHPAYAKKQQLPGPSNHSNRTKLLGDINNEINTDPINGHLEEKRYQIPSLSEENAKLKIALDRVLKQEKTMSKTKRKYKPGILKSRLELMPPFPEEVIFPNEEQESTHDSAEILQHLGVSVFELSGQADQTDLKNKEFYPNKKVTGKQKLSPFVKQRGDELKQNDLKPKAIKYAGSEVSKPEAHSDTENIGKKFQTTTVNSRPKPSAQRHVENSTKHAELNKKGIADADYRFGDSDKEKLFNTNDLKITVLRDEFQKLLSQLQASFNDTRLIIPVSQSEKRLTSEKDKPASRSTRPEKEFYSPSNTKSQPIAHTTGRLKESHPKKISYQTYLSKNPLYILERLEAAAEESARKKIMNKNPPEKTTDFDSQKNLQQLIVDLSKSSISETKILHQKLLQPPEVKDNILSRSFPSNNDQHKILVNTTETGNKISSTYSPAIKASEKTPKHSKDQYPQYVIPVTQKSVNDDTPLQNQIERTQIHESVVLHQPKGRLSSLYKSNENGSVIDSRPLSKTRETAAPRINDIPGKTVGGKQLDGHEQLEAKPPTKSRTVDNETLENMTNHVLSKHTKYITNHLIKSVKDVPATGKTAHKIASSMDSKHIPKHEKLSVKIVSTPATLTGRTVSPKPIPEQEEMPDKVLPKSKILLEDKSVRITINKVLENLEKSSVTTPSTERDHKSLLRLIEKSSPQPTQFSSTGNVSEIKANSLLPSDKPSHRRLTTELNKLNVTLTDKPHAKSLTTIRRQFSEDTSTTSAGSRTVASALKDTASALGPSVAKTATARPLPEFTPLVARYSSGETTDNPKIYRKLDSKDTKESANSPSNSTHAFRMSGATGQTAPTSFEHLTQKVQIETARLLRKQTSETAATEQSTTFDKRTKTSSLPSGNGLKIFQIKHASSAGDTSAAGEAVVSDVHSLQSALSTPSSWTKNVIVTQKTTEEIAGDKNLVASSSPAPGPFGKTKKTTLASLETTTPFTTALFSTSIRLTSTSTRLTSISTPSPTISTTSSKPLNNSVRSISEQQEVNVTAKISSRKTEPAEILGLKVSPKVQDNPFLSFFSNLSLIVPNSLSMPDSVKNSTFSSHQNLSATPPMTSEHNTANLSTHTPKRPLSHSAASGETGGHISSLQPIIKSTAATPAQSSSTSSIQTTSTQKQETTLNHSGNSSILHPTTMSTEINSTGKTGFTATDTTPTKPEKNDTKFQPGKTSTPRVLKLTLPDWVTFPNKFKNLLTETSTTSATASAMYGLLSSSRIQKTTTKSVQDTTENTTIKIVQDTSENATTKIVQDTSENTTTKIVQDKSENTTSKIVQDTSENTTTKIVQDTSENTTTKIVQDTSENTTTKIVQDTPEKTITKFIKNTSEKKTTEAVKSTTEKTTREAVTKIKPLSQSKQPISTLSTIKTSVLITQKSSAKKVSTEKPFIKNLMLSNLLPNKIFTKVNKTIEGQEKESTRNNINAKMGTIDRKMSIADEDVKENNVEKNTRFSQKKQLVKSSKPLSTLPSWKILKNDSEDGPKVVVPKKGLFVPQFVHYDDVNGTGISGSEARHVSLRIQQLSVGKVFSRYWPAILGLTVGTVFLVVALLTSIACRQQRLFIQRRQGWQDTPQHLTEPPDTSEYTSSASSLASDNTRSSIHFT